MQANSAPRSFFGFHHYIRHEMRHNRPAAILAGCRSVVFGKWANN
jgi:hypothetical protein